MDVSIVIVSWRVKDQLINCINSITRETKGLVYEVFVVDNNSKDGTVEVLEDRYSDINLIKNSENEGFAKACNQAIKKSSGDFILLLNPDTEIKDNAIFKSVQFAIKMTNSGIIGCRVVNQDGSIQPSVRSFPDILSHILISLKIHNFYSDLSALKKYYLSDFNYSESKIVDQVMGAFFLIKREVIKKIGLLDEHFYIWFEEVDFCKRALLKGWKTYYFSNTEIVHQKGSSFNKRNAIVKQMFFNRSMLYYFFKHSNILNYLILLILYPISILLALLVYIFRIKKKNNKL